MKLYVFSSLLMASLLALAGCEGVPAPGERQARTDLKAVARAFPTNTAPPALPKLTPNSTLSNYLAVALLNAPSVQAAFYNWSASVEGITIARSRPDPQVTFMSYVTDRLTSLMPGLAWDFPGPGKLKARANTAIAASDAKYFAVENALLAAAYDFEQAYYRLGLLDDQLRLKREILRLLDDLDRARRAQSETGQIPLAEVLRLEGERDRLRAEIAGLADSRMAAIARFKVALGFGPLDADPPIPVHYEFNLAEPNEEGLLCTALTNNPALREMEAQVRVAEAGIAVAYQERMPDFNASLSAEVYSPPFFWPQAGMTLPIWRDKLAAEAAQAQANRLSAQRRWQAGQIELAVSFAEKSFAGRETSRQLALIEDQLLPNARQSLAAARAGYRTGAVDFSSLTDAERTPLELEIAAAENRAEHELALAGLSLLVAGVPPPGAPGLPAKP